jgi:hypothetical protein
LMTSSLGTCKKIFFSRNFFSQYSGEENSRVN